MTKAQKTRRVLRRTRNLLLHPANIAFWVAALFVNERLPNGLRGTADHNLGDALVPLGLIWIVTYVVLLGLAKLTSKADLVTDSRLRDSIQSAVEEAQEELVVVSPYLDPGNAFVESLLKASQRGVDISLIVHSTQLNKPMLHATFERLDSHGVRVLHHPKVHAKLCLSESVAVVSSLNMVTRSYADSFEAGIESDYGPIKREVKAYISEKILASDLVEPVDVSSMQPREGYCIRTRRNIQFDPDRPIERGEYFSSGKSHDGRYCHACGKPATTSLNSPFCEVHSVEYRAGQLGTEG